MTLANILRQQLNSSEPGGFHVSLGDWGATVVVEKKDSMSCLLTELTVRNSTPAAQDVRTWGERIASRATGLLEPLRLLEADARLNQALLRSTAPMQRDGQSLYYEMALTRDTATLHRYVGQIGARRETIPFALTHDAIVKLVADIVG
ncbi:MAG: hypothetical protein EXS16_14635 [Gemmataceae bacterium]|nr:hypothetical protein [Gemmataceae bacterium]